MTPPFFNKPSNTLNLLFVFGFIFYFNTSLKAQNTSNWAGDGYDPDPGVWIYNDNSNGSGWGSNNQSTKEVVVSINPYTDIALMDDDPDTKYISRYSCDSYYGSMEGLKDIFVYGYIDGKKTRCMPNSIFIRLYKESQGIKTHNSSTSSYYSNNNSSASQYSNNSSSTDDNNNSSASECKSTTTPELIDYILNSEDNSDNNTQSVSPDKKETDKNEKLIGKENNKYEKHAGNKIIDLSNVNDVVLLESLPTFQGEGIRHFRNWVTNLVQYPETCVEKGIQGTVVARIIVSKTGKVVNYKITQGVDPDLDAEVIRILKTSPD